MDARVQSDQLPLDPKDATVNPPLSRLARWLAALVWLAWTCSSADSQTITATRREPDER